MQEYLTVNISEPVYNNKYPKPKIRPGKNFAYFHGKNAPEIGFNYICIPTILINFILKKKQRRRVLPRSIFKMHQQYFLSIFVY